MAYRAALIGCGKIGSEFADDPRIKGIYTHAGAYDACPSTRLVAVCDTSRDKAERCAARWNAEAAYTDPAAMLRECRPDIVSICSPDETHFDLLCTAIGSDGVRAVLVEKPLASNLKEARHAVRLAEAKGVKLAVNYSRRYSLGHQQLKERLANGEIGPLQAVGGYYTKGTRHNGSHWFDLARFLLGEVDEVWARDVRKEGGDDPTLDVFLSFRNGSAAFLHALDARAYSLFEMDIIGEAGRVRLYDSGHRMAVQSAGDSPCYSGYRTLLPPQDIPIDLEDTLLHAVEDLVASIEENRDPLCSGEDGVAALAIAEAALRSARTGCPVKPGETE